MGQELGTSTIWELAASGILARLEEGMLSLAALSNALQNTLSKISSMFFLFPGYSITQVLHGEMRSSKVVRMIYGFMVKNSCRAEHHNIFDS